MTEIRTIEAPVRRVLVMEDRAQVTRRAEAELLAGRTSFRVEGLTPLAADRTLRARIRSLGGGQARILDVGIRREYVVRESRPERERELTTRIEALADECREDRDRVLGVLHERSHAILAAKLLAKHAGERLGIGAVDPGWKEDFETAFRRRAELEREYLAAVWAAEDKVLRIRALEDERRLTLQPASEYRACLVAEVEAAASGPHVIEWVYQVPCAIWRPDYRATLWTAVDVCRVEWESAGMVWQATGEDWTDVEIAFSTERPTLGAELPLIEDDVVQSRPKTEAEKRVIEVCSRDQAIATTRRVEDIESDTPPGLDDGGEVRVYALPGRVTVPSDGRPHRLSFDSWGAPAETAYRCFPEKSEAVFLISAQTLSSALPLLAGPVALCRNGGFVGRSSIGYVAPGERFLLSWGSEDGIVVLRDVVRKRDVTVLRGRQIETFDVTVYLCNQTGEGRIVKLVERTPVSEIESVEVEVDAKETTRVFSRDAQGIVTWDLDLGPGVERKVRLVFRVKMPSNVVWNG